MVHNNNGKKVDTSKGLATLFQVLKDQGKGKEILGKKPSPAGGDKGGSPLKPPNTGSQEPPRKPMPGPPRPQPKPMPKPDLIPPGTNKPENPKPNVKWDTTPPGVALLNNNRPNPQAVIDARETSATEQVTNADATALVNPDNVTEDTTETTDWNKWVQDNAPLLILGGVALFVLSKK